MALRVLSILLLLAASTLTKGVPNCDQENHYIKILKEANVMIHYRPNFNSNSCGDEWKLHGSCCDFETLKTAVLSDLQSIREDTNKIGISISAVIQEFSQLRNASLDPNKNETNILLAAFREKGLHLLEGITTENITQDATICWNEMATTRSASVCTTCSGRSQIFFSNKKALITQEVCSRVIRKCMPHFMLLSKMSVLAQTIRSSFDGSSKLPTSTKDKLMRIEAIFCSESSLISECQGATTGDINSWMCSNFVRLREKTLLREVDPLLGILKLILVEVTNILTSVKSTSGPVIMSPTFGCTGDNTPEGPGAAYNATDANPFVSTEVQIVKPGDSMFTSFYGTQGTSQDEIAIAKSMNLTCAFP